MNAQAIINGLGGVVCIILGWVLNTLWGMVRDLQRSDAKLTEKVHEVQLVVAGQYVTRAEFVDALKGISSKLDTISDKLDEKADK